MSNKNIVFSKSICNSNHLTPNCPRNHHPSSTTHNVTVWNSTRNTCSVSSGLTYSNDLRFGLLWFFYCTIVVANGGLIALVGLLLFNLPGLSKFRLVFKRSEFKLSRSLLDCTTKWIEMSDGCCCLLSRLIESDIFRAKCDFLNNSFCTQDRSVRQTGHLKFTFTQL